MAGPANQGGQLTPAQLQAVNLQARAVVLGRSVEMVQQIQSVAVAPASQNVIQIQPRNVGLIKGFIVQVDGTIANTGMTDAIALTGHATLNCFTNIFFQDLNNQVRINTSGRHIGLLNTARQGFGFGGAYSPNLPVDISNNWSVQTAPATIAAGATGAIRQIYWVPLAYAADDLRGAIYANVVNATMNLQLTINPTPVAATGDPLAKIYVGNTGGWSGNVTVTVYQVYLDQLPTANGQPILPPTDLNTVYELIETTLTGMAANSDFPYSYANYRDFLSTFATYDNAGVFNVGSDVNYWSLVSANFTQMMKVTPAIAALFARAIFMADPPNGVYYFDHRRRPINTVQFGNMQLNLNASAVTSGASMLVSTEAFAQINQLVGGSSLDAG